MYLEAHNSGFEETEEEISGYEGEYFRRSVLGGVSYLAQID